MRFLQEGPTNAGNDGRMIRVTLSLEDYHDFFRQLAGKNPNRNHGTMGRA